MTGPPLERPRRAAAVRPVPQAKRLPHRARPHDEHTAAVRSLPRRAADLVLDSLAPRRPLPADKSSADISTAVVTTLLAVLGVGLVFACTTFLPARRRLFDPRTWWRG